MRPTREWLFALAVAVLAALLILVGWWMRGVVEAYHVSINTPIVVEAAEPVPPPCLDYWIVGPGDTLWHIAKTCWPEAHTGQMVYEIRRLNPGIDPGRLRVGQVLQLPVATEIVGGVE